MMDDSVLNGVICLCAMVILPSNMLCIIDMFSAYKCITVVVGFIC